MADQISSNGYTSVVQFFDPNSSNLEQHLFYIGIDGTLNDVFWDTRRWDSRVLQGAAPADLTNPIAVWFSESIHVFYRDVGGQLATMWYSLSDIKNEYRWHGPSLLGGAPVGCISGSTYSVDGSDSEAHVYFATASGDLAQTLLDASGRFNTNLPLPGVVNSAPTLGVSAQTYSWRSGTTPVNEQHVFFRGASGSLAQSFASDSSTHFVEETLPGTPRQTPAVVRNEAGGEHVQSVVFVDDNQDVIRCWEDSGTWESEPTGGKARGNVIGSTYFKDGCLELHAFFLGLGGELEQTWRDHDGWHQRGLGVHPSCLLGSGNYHPGGGHTEQHVFWRDEKLGLNQSWYNGVIWRTQQLPTVTPVHDGVW